MSLVIGPIFERKDYAGFLRRTLALLFDLALISSLFYGVPWVWYYFAPAAWVTLHSYAWIYAGGLIAGVLYMLGLRMTEGGTLGYRIVGIRYAYMLGDRPSWLMRAYRAFWAVILLATFLLDHIWILFDERKQTWHDKLSGFYVVRRHARPIAQVAIKNRYIAFMSFSFLVFEPENG